MLPPARWSKRLCALAELGAAGALLAIALLAWIYFVYARPAADDFCVAWQGRQLGAAGYADFIWETKSGRWTGHALLALVLAHVDMIHVYPWLLAGVALVALGASFVFLRVVLAETTSKRSALCAALALQALLWAGDPALGQTHYWFSGAVPYQLGFACSLLVVAGLVARARLARAGVLGWAVLPLLGLAVPGLQELTGMMLAVALAAGTWVAFRLRLATRWMWPWSLALVAAGCVVSVLAPGNAARAAEHPQGGDVLLTLRYLGLDGLRATRAWVLEPKCLGLTLLLWMSLPSRAPRPRWIRPGVNWPALVAVTGLAALAIGLAGPRWATGTWQPPRMLAVVYMTFLHAWFVLLFLVTRNARGLPRAPWVRASAMGAALLALGAGLFLVGNGRRALGDLAYGRTQRWAQSRERRYELIELARTQGRRDLLVPRAPMAPRVFVPMDVREDPTYWENTCAALYFGLDSIALQPAASAPPASPGAR